MKNHLKYTAKYIRHYFRSRSKFEIHSPFAYDFYAEIMMDRAEYPGCREIKEKRSISGADMPLKFAHLLFRIAKYFRPANILVLSGADELMTTCIALGSPGCRVIRTEDLSAMEEDRSHYDFICYGLPFSGRQVDENISRIMQHIHNDSVLIMKNLYESRDTPGIWKKIQNEEPVTLSMDLFFLGLVFFRKELSREEFILHY